MKKEYEPVNCLAKLYKDPFGLKDAVNKSINDITKGKSFKRPTELANSYLEKLGACPKHLRTVSNMEEAYKNLIKVSAKLNPQEAKSIRCELKRVKKEIFDGMRGRIHKDTLQAIEKDYSKQTLDKILEALIDFEIFLNGGHVKVINDDMKKAILYFKKKHQNVIKSTVTLLKEAGLSDSERKVMQEIKSRHQDHLKQLLQLKEIILTPVQETLLNLNATAGPLLRFNSAEWTREYLEQFGKSFIVKKPEGKPRKSVLNTLVIVIYRLLEKEGKQIKWLHSTTAKIINQCLRFNDTDALTPKRVENTSGCSSPNSK